jgi:hypothetical protein
MLCIVLAEFPFTYKERTYILRTKASTATTKHEPERAAPPDTYLGPSLAGYM